MADCLANAVCEGVEDDLADHEKEDAEDDVSNWPAVLEGICDKQDLHNQVDEKENAVEDVQNNKKTNSLGW